MEASKTKEIRQRLSNDYQGLIHSIEHGRFAAEEIKVESSKCFQCQESTEADQTTAGRGPARLDVNEIES